MVLADHLLFRDTFNTRLFHPFQEIRVESGITMILEGVEEVIMKIQGENAIRLVLLHPVDHHGGSLRCVYLVPVKGPIHNMQGRLHDF